MKNKNKENLSWNDITILDFIHIEEILKSDELEELEKKIELLKILTHNNDIDNLPIYEFNKYVPLLNLLGVKIPHNKMKKQYEFLGKKWNTCDKIEKITTGQYIDYMNLCEKPVTVLEMSKVIGFLLVPEGGKYNTGYDMDELCAAIEREMPITEAYGFVDFFVEAQAILSRRLRDYLIQQILKMKAPMKARLKVIKNLWKVERNLELDWLNMV